MRRAIIFLALVPWVFGQALPDHKLTPGVVCPTVTVADLSSPAFIREARVHGTKDGEKITDVVKAMVYTEYGIISHVTGQYEIDHLVSIELGGSNDIRNLWPQPYAGPWNAHQKDRLENELHRRVLAGKMALTEAQAKIATDWVALYQAIFPADVIGGSPKSVAAQPNSEPDL